MDAHTAQGPYRVPFHPRMLHPRYWLDWLAVGLLALFAFVPPSLRRLLAYPLARLLKPLCRKPVAVARKNLASCYPHWSAAKRERLINQLLVTFVCTGLGLGELALRRKSFLSKRIEIDGLAHLEAARAEGKAVVFLVPHMFALEYAAAGLAMTGLPMIGMIKHHRSPVLNWAAYRQRLRFGGELFHRDAGMPTIVRQLKQGNSLFYLPDQDHGEHCSVFAPFFSCQKATLPVISRIARCSDAVVVPLSVGFVGTDGRARIQLDAPLPLAKLDKDEEARLLNQQMERLIGRHPDQYMWFLKILKSRPLGEPKLY